MVSNPKSADKPEKSEQKSEKASPLTKKGSADDGGFKELSFDELSALPMA